MCCTVTKPDCSNANGNCSKMYARCAFNHMLMMIQLPVWKRFYSSCLNDSAAYCIRLAWNVFCIGQKMACTFRCGGSCPPECAQNDATRQFKI